MLNKGVWVLNSMAPGFWYSFLLRLFSGIPWDGYGQEDWREGHNGVGGVLPDTIVLGRLGDSVCYIEFLSC
jgi:hypothetical protein